jgi:DNA repair exonuclease SbcCD nuclease subunit
MNLGMSVFDDMSDKVLFIADVHLGVGNRLDDIIWALKSIRQYASDNEIEHVFILGDLFHDRTKVTTDVSCAAYNFFKETKNLFNQEWIVLPGNHDMYLKAGWEITSLRPLSDVLTVFSDVTLVKIGDRRFWLLPFIYYEDVYMRVLQGIHEHHQPGDVLLTHTGSHNATLNECFLIKHWSVVDFTNSPFDRIYSGHFHCHQQVGANMWYVGSPIPFKFDEGVVDHGFIEFDLDTRQHKFINIFKISTIPGLPPDYPTIVDDAVETIDSATVVGNNIRVALNREYTSVELAAMREKLMKMGARRVAWMKAKEEELDLSVQTSEEVSMSEPLSLLKMWIERDKPDYVDNDYLFKLNDEVVNEGNERINVEEEVWES